MQCLKYPADSLLQEDSARMNEEGLFLGKLLTPASMIVIGFACHGRVSDASPPASDPVDRRNEDHWQGEDHGGARTICGALPPGRFGLVPSALFALKVVPVAPAQGYLSALRFD